MKNISVLPSYLDGKEDWNEAALTEGLEFGGRASFVAATDVFQRRAQWIVSPFLREGRSLFSYEVFSMEAMRKTFSLKGA